VVCRGYLAWDLWLLGYPDQAVQRSNEALARAHEVAHPFSLAFAACFAAALHQFRRDGEAVQEHARATMALASEQGFPLYLALGTILWGWALAARGHREDGITQMYQGLDASRTVGNELVLPHFPTMLAEAYGVGGQAEEGLAVLEMAMAAVHKSEARFYEAEIHRLTGEILLQHAVPDASGVDACFQKALAVARHQQAKSLELRTAMSLARLWQQQGKRQEAYDLLTPIYGWFTEGFDTADLQEATTLLEELAG
jgi:predicted ATPase